MALWKYPVGDQDRDTRTAPKRDTHMTMGAVGVVVYTYKLSLETPRFAGKLYHPVDTYSDAAYWLNYYKTQTEYNNFQPVPLYQDAWFIPRGET